MLDFRSATNGIGVDQEPNAFGQRPRDWNLRGMEQGDDVPAQVLGGTGREGRIEISSDGEQRTDDVVRLELIGLNQRPEELVGCGQNFGGVIVSHRRGSPDAMDTNGWAHAN